MPFVLTEDQQTFVDAYKERYGFDDEVVIHRALSALAAEESEAAGEIEVDDLYEIINKYCELHMLGWNGSFVDKEPDGHWVLGDEFSTGDDMQDDAFPKHWSSFRQFMKAYGFRIDVQSPGLYSIWKFDD